MAADATGSIPPAIIVDHILGVTSGAPWPVQSAALQAVLRRIAFMQRDALGISSQPTDRRVLGAYSTSGAREGSRRRTTRPYAMVVESVTPFVARCSCPDYVRNSLALCKHSLAVLEHLSTHPRLLVRAAREQAELAAAGAQPRLVWDPIRPLTGLGDWLDRVGLLAPEMPARGPVRTSIARRFARASRENVARLRETAADDPLQRLEIVDDLIAISQWIGRDGGPMFSDPALRSLLFDERERLERTIRDRQLARDLPRLTGLLRRPLYAYQVEGVARFLEAGRLLLADDMGLGKTVQAIAAADILWRAQRVRRGLVITPASLKTQWRREWIATTDAPVQILEGGPEERAAMLETTRQGFLIANYEQVIRDLEAVLGWGPELLVIDEAQRIKNWSTKTALAVKKIDAPYRLALSGTPLENRFDELASLLDVADDRALEPKWRTIPFHLTVEGNAESGGARRAVHLDTLRSRIARCTVRRVRREVLDQLPERTDTRVPVEMTAQQTEEHDALRVPIASLLSIRERRPLTQAEFLRLMQLLTTQRMISNGLALYRYSEMWPVISGSRPTPHILEGLFSPKLLDLRELVCNLAVEQGRKLVIFSQWRRMLKLASWAVSDILADSGLRAVFFTGAEKRALREQAVIELHDDPRVRIMFLTDAGGVGLNLQRAATVCVNLELPWNPAVLEQRIGRIHRLGQEHKIDVYNLISEAGIESRIADLVGEKRALFNGFFDGASDEIQFTRQPSFFERLEQILSSGTPGPRDVEEDADAVPSAAVVAEEEQELARALEDVVATPSLDVSTKPANGSLPSPAGEPIVSTPPPPSGPPLKDIRALFAEIRVSVAADGSVELRAPKEAAQELADLFVGFAAMLRNANV